MIILCKIYSQTGTDTIRFFSILIPKYTNNEITFLYMVRLLDEWNSNSVVYSFPTHCSMLEAQQAQRWYLHPNSITLPLSTPTPGGWRGTINVIIISWPEYLTHYLMSGDTPCHLNYNSLAVTGLHQELPPEGPQEDPHGREAVQLQLGGMWLEVCSVWRVDETPQKTHGDEALQVSPLW